MSAAAVLLAAVIGPLTLTNLWLSLMDRMGVVVHGDSPGRLQGLSL